MNLRSTSQAAKELDIDRDVLAWLIKIGAVRSTRPVGRSVVWPDQAMNEARRAVAKLTTPEACA